MFFCEIGHFQFFWFFTKNTNSDQFKFSGYIKGILLLKMVQKLDRLGLPIIFYEFFNFTKFQISKKFKQFLIFLKGDLEVYFEYKMK
jgi:hypothetical protein